MQNNTSNICTHYLQLLRSEMPITAASLLIRTDKTKQDRWNFKFIKLNGKRTKIEIYLVNHHNCATLVFPSPVPNSASAALKSHSSSPLKPSFSSCEIGFICFISEFTSFKFEFVNPSKPFQVELDPSKLNVGLISVSICSPWTYCRWIC